MPSNVVLNVDTSADRNAELIEAIGMKRMTETILNICCGLKLNSKNRSENLLACVLYTNCCPKSMLLPEWLQVLAEEERLPGAAVAEAWGSTAL